MKHRSAYLARGFTLIELMIATVVGLLVVAAALSLFLSSSRTHRSIEQMSALLDNSRVAVSLIEREVKLTGYWGLVSRAHLIRGRKGVTGAINPSVTNDCAGGTQFIVDLEQPLQVFDNTPVSGCLTGYVNGTDVLVVRRVATGWTGGPLDNSTLYIKSDHMYGEVFLGNTPPTSVFAAVNETRTLRVYVYYVGTNSANAASSSLRRLRLAPGPELIDDEMVPGVEDLQIELGLDADGDDSVDAYVSPTAAGAAASDALAARISVLLHADGRDISYVDNEDYLALGAAQKRKPALERRRMQFSKTVLLRN